MKPVLKISFHTEDNSSNKFEFTHKREHIKNGLSNMSYVINRFGMIFDNEGNRLHDLLVSNKPAFIHIIVIANDITETYERVLTTQQIETLRIFNNAYTEYEMLFSKDSKIQNLSRLKNKIINNI